jgi:hypothetical protein
MQVSGKKVMIAFGVIGALTLAAVLIGFRRIGWDRFQANTKLMEGKNNVITIARALIVCADNTGRLPESSGPVPPSLADVGGTSFLAREGDWSDPAWRCAKYTHVGEQRFRYTWLKKSDTEGTVRAEADFDGNGSAEAVYEQDVLCGIHAGAFRCRPGDYRDIAQMR